MESEHIPNNLSIQTIIALGEIDISINEMLRELGELGDDVDFNSEIDRTIVIHLMRMCYLKGREDAFALLMPEPYE